MIDRKIIERNTSYIQVLIAQNDYFRAQKAGSENTELLHELWATKAALHEKEYGR